MTIKKVRIFKNKIIKNKKGHLIKFVSTKNLFFKKFGEIYFNEINFKKQKGWNKHLKNNCLIQCVYGKVKFHLIDKLSKEKKYILKCGSGSILRIPPNVWFSFRSLEKKSIIANMIESPHRDLEVIKSNKIKNYLIG